MQRSSEVIGAIAAALAKAQAEMTNPEKSLTATIRSLFRAKAIGRFATPRYQRGSTSSARRLAGTRSPPYRRRRSTTRLG